MEPFKNVDPAELAIAIRIHDFLLENTGGDKEEAVKLGCAAIAVLMLGSFGDEERPAQLEKVFEMLEETIGNPEISTFYKQVRKRQ